MSDDLIIKYSWVIWIVVLGSFVDLCQFVWIMRRWFRKVKRVVYNRVRREILEDYGRHKKAKGRGAASGR